MTETPLPSVGPQSYDAGSAFNSLNKVACPAKYHRDHLAIPGETFTLINSFQKKPSFTPTRQLPPFNFNSKSTIRPYPTIDSARPRSRMDSDRPALSFNISTASRYPMTKRSSPREDKRNADLTTIGVSIDPMSLNTKSIEKTFRTIEHVAKDSKLVFKRKSRP